MVLISEEAAKPVPVTEKVVVPAAEIKAVPTLESIGDPIPFPFVNIPKHLQKNCSTYKQLFTTVDTEKCSADVYAEALALHTNSLFYGLHSYRPPSQQSRQKLGTGKSKIRWRSKDRFVSDVEALFAIRISDELQLDELQSYDLLISYAYDTSLDASASFMFDDESLQAVKNYYYSERSYLLQSIISVLRNTLSEEHVFHKESSEVMAALIAQGIDDELMNQFVELAENTPLHMTNSEGALQMVDEMTTILCGLFLLYYHEAPQSLEKLLYVLGVFKGTGFCECIYAAEYINFNEQIKNSIVYLKHMCVLVSLVLLQLEDLLYDDKQQFMEKIEALNLEFNNLPQPTDPNTSTSSNSSNTSTIIGNTSARIGNTSTIIENSENNPNMEWGKVDAHAPVMLAWYLWKVSGTTSNNLPDEDYRMMSKILVEGRAISYLINMLKNGLDKDDIAINGYKSVVKGLVSAILSIFSEDAPLWKSIPIFELYCLTNENSPPLASLFWEVELKHPVLGGWVRDASGKFPLQPAPLLQVMHALSSDANSAKNAYDYIEALTTYTVSLSDGEDIHRRLTSNQIDDQLKVVVATSPNTRGVQTPDGTICWDLTYDGWRGIISDIYDLSKDNARYETVLASLKLISNLMSFNDEIVHRFYSAYDGMLPKILPTFLLECLHYGQPLPLSAAALNCIYYFAKTCSASQMWRKLNPTLFHSLRNAVDFQEPASRSYSVTLGILDLTDCVLHSNAQTARSELYNETAVPLQLFELEDAMRFCNAVFSNFSSWVYNVVREKWIIGSRAMDIFHKVLTDYAPIPNSGENENNSRVHKLVLLNVLVNKEVQRNLFSIISLGVETIEESQKHKDLLETFVLLALALVDVALTMLPSEQITTLQSALFEGNTLDSIAGFSRYKINPDISVRALRILTHASETGVSLSSHVLHDHLRLRNSWLSSLSLSLSSPSSSSSSMCFHILSFFCSILKYQPTLIINICGKELPGYVEKGKNTIEGEHASLVKVILLLFDNKIMEKNPQVCSELCHLIFLLCTKAPNLDTVVELRSNKIFWEHLVSIVISKQIETAFHISARAWALLTISLELDQPKHMAQGAFSSIANKETQSQWVVNYIPTFLKEHLNKCVPNKGFASVPIISSNFNLDTVYGDRFFYNVTRMERNYAPEGLLEKVKSANLCLSLAHSHSLFLKAWNAAHNCYSVWFVEVPKMVCEISGKLINVLENEIEQSSIFDGVAPLFLAVCKLLPHPAKLDAPSLSKIFAQVANVFTQHTRAKPEALSHICTAIVQLVRQEGMGPTFWRDSDLLHECENLVDACWSLVDVSPDAALHDSIFSLLGSILKVTESPKLILNSKKQPSLMTLMSVLARTLQRHENARHAENLMSLIHQLASTPLGGSSLLLDGLPNVLCNLSSPFFSSFSLLPYSASPSPSPSPSSSNGCRNAWHRVWCACVRVVTQLLRSLKFTDDVARRAVEFVNTHAKRLYDSITLQNKELTVGALEELEATVQLIKELAIYTNKWKYAPPEFANAWGNSIVRLSQYLVLIFSAENGLKQHIVRSRDPAEASLPENYHEELLLRNLVSSFYILQLSGPQLTKLLAAQDSAALTSEVASVTYIFAPTFDFGPNSIPNVYIPIYAIHHSFAALRAMMTSATQSTTTSYPNNLHPRLSSLLISLIELSLSLFLSHLIYFLHKLDLHTYPDSVQKLHGLGAELVYQITNYLVDLATYEKDLVVIRHLNSYLASILRVPQ